MQPDVFTSLPHALAERIRPANTQPLRAGQKFVLYWMHHALRVAENPALDAARIAASSMGAQLLVLHTIPDATPYASDRFHTFQLQGARDVAADCAALGISYALHLPRRESDTTTPPALAQLARLACLVVTEDMPVYPWRAWIESLARELDTAGVALWAVDAACVVPMRLCDRAHDRAFAYRDATRKLRAARVRAPWPTLPESAAGPPLPFAGPLPFSPPDIAGADDAEIARLVAACAIDHTVGPVPHTRGGSAAALMRWDNFKTVGLARYSKTRNDALTHGVSRMSAYLHYGMISPMLVARDAAAADGDGAEKYLDELMVWRELAYTWCVYRDDHERLSSVPAWARQTLAAHERDKRPALYSWETLARARTGDALWDAAQSSLLVQGELHNNVRMTWGKALLNWTPNAERCLELLVDLNHRYALDGRDPASFGGLLWCLGLFDRPFEPEQPIVGAVRPRPTREHARQLDPTLYARKTMRPMYLSAASGEPLRVAVVGAGLAGLMCARTLADHRVVVTVFDKGRGPGGRISTRRSEAYQFDHGAQYLTCRGVWLKRLAASWLRDGVIAEWTPRLVDLRDGVATARKGGEGDAVAEDGAKKAAGVTQHPKFVGTPGMSALTAHLAEGVTEAEGAVVFGTEISRAERRDERWALLSAGPQGAERELGLFDVVVLATPPANIAKVLGASPAGAGALAALAPVTMLPTWAVMAAWDRPLDVPFDGAFIGGDAVLAWAGKDSSKPGRRPGPQAAGGAATSADELWVLHASHEWSLANIELDAEQAAAEVLAAFGRQIGGLRSGALPKPAYVAAHRWRYAAVGVPLGRPSWFDEKMGLGLCGDWCDAGPSKVEKALLSGAAMAGEVMGAANGQVAKSSNGQMDIWPTDRVAR